VLPLVAIIFFSSSGGPYGIETVLSSSGIGMSLILLITIPLLLSLPMSLMNAELSSALPLEGGFYSWVKIACGSFAGFMEAMLSWMASWLDTALYPIIFVDYLAIWIPDVARGKHVLFSFFGGNFSIDLHWFMAIALMVPSSHIKYCGRRDCRADAYHGDDCSYCATTNICRNCHLQILIEPFN
jgi:amino acid transporter